MYNFTRIFAYKNQMINQMKNQVKNLVKNQVKNLVINHLINHVKKRRITRYISVPNIPTC